MLLLPEADVIFFTRSVSFVVRIVRGTRVRVSNNRIVRPVHEWHVRKKKLYSMLCNRKKIIEKGRKMVKKTNVRRIKQRVLIDSRGALLGRSWRPVT